MARAHLKQDILLAANRVLAREGLMKTTVEAVAKEAGVSKGGLFYYFQNKKEILIGMLEQYEAGFLKAREAVLAEIPPSPRRLLMATAVLMLRDMKETAKEIPNLATLLDDPELRNWVGAFKLRIFGEASREIENKAGVAMVGYLIDGLWMDTRFEVGLFDSQYKEEAAKKLLEFIETLS